MLTIAVTVGFIRLKNSIATALVIVNVQCVCVCLDLVCGLNASLFNRVQLTIMLILIFFWTVTLWCLNYDFIIWLYIKKINEFIVVKVLYFYV